jgi:hypothetical protein
VTTFSRHSPGRFVRASGSDVSVTIAALPNTTFLLSRRDAASDEALSKHSHNSATAKLELAELFEVRRRKMAFAHPGMDQVGVVVSRLRSHSCVAESASAPTRVKSHSNDMDAMMLCEERCVN